MSKFLLYSSINNHRTMTSSRTRKKSLLNFKAIKTIVLVLAVLMVISYILQVNKVATAGYEIKQLHQKINHLKEENTKLQIQAAELESRSKVEEDSTALEMVVAPKIKYLTSSSSVALEK
jgi:cell division protein FtsL